MNSQQNADKDLVSLSEIILQGRKYLQSWALEHGFTQHCNGFICGFTMNTHSGGRKQTTFYKDNNNMHDTKNMYNTSKNSSAIK